MKITTTILAIITAIVSLTAQEKQSISFSYTPTNSDGLHFDVEMDYIANVYGGPEFRVVIKSVDITGITYKGEFYDKNNSNLTFPNNKDIKGSLYLKGRIRHKTAGLITSNSIIYFSNCNISIELSKKTTTANSLQDGGSAYFSEAITDVSFKNKEESLKELKLNSNWKKDWLDVSWIDELNVEKYQDLHIPGGMRIEEYLKRQIEINSKNEEFEYKFKGLEKSVIEGEPVAFYEEKMKKAKSLSTNKISKENKKRLTELIAKIESLVDDSKSQDKFNSLKTYTQYSSKKSIAFYKEGIKKANEIAKTLTSSGEKERLNNILKQIQNSLSEAQKGERIHEELEADLKRIEEEAEEKKKNSREVRLSPEELARINQQIAYNNTVKGFTNKGIDLHQAHKMAQSEYNIQLIDNVVGTALNQISGAIMNGINRSYEKKEARREEMYSYNSDLRNYAETLTRTNRNYIDDLDQNLPLFKNSSNNTEDLKQEILWIIENLGNTKFAYQNKFVYKHYTDGRFLSHEATVIVEQKIEDAYFKGNTLYIKFKHKAKEATFDKAHLSKLTDGWQPSKFDLTSLVEYDIENNIKAISRKSYWSGRGSLPGNGFLSSNDFLKQLKLIDGNIYVKPFGSSGNEGVYWREKRNFGLVLTDDWILRTKFSKLKELLIKKEIEANIANPNFTKQFTKTVEDDLKNYWKILGGKPSIIQNTTKLTSNPNEISVISIWEDKYMILTFPGEKLFEQLNPKSISSKNGYLNPKNNKATVTTKINKYDEKFRLSYFSDQNSIGGNSGEDLLLTGSHEQVLEKKIYSFFVNNNLVKDTWTGEKFNPDVWNPYIEIGTFEKLVEYDYINDTETKVKLEKKGFKNISVYNYRSNPDGIYLKFKPKVLAMIMPVEINKYQFQDKIKGTLQMSNQSAKGEFLHYKPYERKPGLAMMLYKKEKNDVYYRNIKQYEPLNNVNPLFYSDQFLNSDYDYLLKYKIGSARYNPFDFKGMGGRMQSYYTMFKEISTMDFSPNAIKYNGKTPTFYSNGKLKTLGAKVNGKKSGSWEFYSQEGVLVKDVNYRSGFQHTISLVRKYDLHGNVISAEGFDVYGIQNLTEYYDYKTEIKRETYYEDGIKYEDFLYKAKSIYDENAVLFESHTYEDGMLIETTKY